MSGDDIEELQKDVVSDKKEEWRVKQISEEGSDPALTGGGAGEASGGIGGGEETGGPELGGGEETGGGEEAGGGEAGGLPPLEEETREDRERGNRDQTGNKEKYSDTFTKTRGEDILGNGQNKEKSKSDRRTRHIYRGSPLSMDEDLKSIKKSLMNKYSNQKTVLTEEKSILDESNIVQDDKPL